MKKGQIIILDGCPSSGKTSIANALQKTMSEPYLYADIDSFVMMLPHQWNQDLDPHAHQEVSPEGLTYQRKVENGHPSITMQLGVKATHLIHGYIHTLKSLAETGNNVIADTIITNANWLTYMEDALKDFSHILVGVYAPLEVLEQREQQIGKWPGLARGHFDLVYTKDKPYNVFIDTSKMTVSESITAICDALSHG